MSDWTKDELEAIATADELEIAPLRRDGTPRKPTTIWVVRDGDDLYVRSVRGPDSGWFRGTQERGEGRISAGGIEKDVSFVPADDEINDEVDSLYRSKYERYGEHHLNPEDGITNPQARS